MPNTQRSNWIFLYSSNFLGVFNDNLLKNSIIFISINWTLPSVMNKSMLITLVSACLILPYLIFSPYAGNLTVRISKLKIFRTFKLIELTIMALASISFYFQHIYLAIVAVLLMGIQSSMYSPAKYSLIRDIGGEKGVALGSGMFETMAFLGILAGTVVGSIISDHYQLWMLVVIFLLVAAGGYASTAMLQTEELPPENTTAKNNPFRFLWEAYHEAKNYKNVNLAILGSALFWMIGGMLQMNIVMHTPAVFNTTNTATGTVMAFAAIGIALGCVVAGKFSTLYSLKILILSGIAGMFLFLLAITYSHPNFYVYTGFVFAFAFSGGFFQVPCLTIVQQSDAGRKLGDLIAYLNLATFVLVLIGTFIFWFTTLISQQNSYAVFNVLALICILCYGIFINLKK